MWRQAQQTHCIPTSPSIQATGTKSEPTNKNVLLSRLEYRVANIKEELGIRKVCETSDEGNLVLNKFLVEIKDEDK